jgi:acyl carrier protein
MNKDMAFRTSWMQFKKLVCDYIVVNMYVTRPYDTFEQLGLDSLDFVELILMVEEEFNVDFDNNIDAVKTIGGLHVLLIRTLEGQREVEITHKDTFNSRCSHCGAVGSGESI